MKLGGRGGEAGGVCSTSRQPTMAVQQHVASSETGEHQNV